MFRLEATLLREFLELDQRGIDVRGRERHGLADDLARSGGIVRRRDEDVPPHGGHLRAVLLAKDVREALPAEARANHVEIAFRVDVELDAVRREARFQDRMEATAEVPPVLRRPVQDDFRLVTPDQLGHHLGIRPGRVGLEDRIVHYDYAVETVADCVPREIVDPVSREDPRQRRAA